MGGSNPVVDGLMSVRGSINSSFAGTEPIKLIALSVAAAWALKSINDARYGEHSVYTCRRLCIVWALVHAR
jgi:hypothetical protein